MKLLYKDLRYKYSAESTSEFIKQDKFWSKLIFPYHQSGNAYPYFYNMIITGRPLHDYLDEIYKSNPIDRFMDKSYQFMVENEEEIRS